jgi:Ca-activated chloride channel homolog
MLLTVRTDRALVRAEGGSIRYALVELTAPEAAPRAGRAPVNVALVLDRSGSMGGEKIVLARQAVGHAFQLLKPSDRFSLVAFDDVVDIVVSSTPGTAEAKRHALERLEQIDARGSTNLEGGWDAGCREAAGHRSGDAVGRCLLVTDGQANLGESDPEQLGRLAAAMRQRGVTTSTFGIGADFDERTLHQMAERGQGNFYFLETPQAIPDLLASELGDILEIVAHEASLVLHVPDGVGVEPVGPFRVSSAGHVVRIELGDLTSGQERRVVLKLTFPVETVGEELRVRFGLTAREDVFAEESRDVAWTFAGHPKNDAQRRDRVVDRAVARLYVAVAHIAALHHNREGRFDEARRVLEAVARKIASYAGSDLELRRIVSELRGEIAAFSMHMDPMESKRRHFASYAVQNLRTAEGKPHKRT